MKRLLITIITIIFCQTCFGQTFDKEYALSIKKNAEYLYAENADKDIAFNLLMKEVRDFNNFETQIDSTIQNVWNKSESFEYQPVQGSLITFFYILKKDLLVQDEMVPFDLPLEILRDTTIQFVFDHKNYNDLIIHLERQKLEHHNIQYKLIRGDDGTRNCYWIVFDKKRNIIAVLDKTLTTDLLNSKSVDYTDYVNYPKIWLQIF